MEVSMTTVDMKIVYNKLTEQLILLVIAQNCQSKSKISLLIMNSFKSVSKSSKWKEGNCWKRQIVNPKDNM